jgi:ribosomal protein S18 acetylase RimI-like enzyme
VQNARTIDRAASHDLAWPSTQPGHRLSHRPATVADEDFLLALFAESRPELALLPAEVRTELIRMQFDLQLRQYRRSAPDAVDWIAELNHDGRAERVGRYYLRQGPREHRLLDLAIRCRWRRHGFGSIVLARLCDGAAQAAVPLRLTVWHANHDALRLYRRYGFVADQTESDREGEVSGLAGYVRLLWSAEGRR